MVLGAWNIEHFRVGNAVAGGSDNSKILQEIPNRFKQRVVRNSCGVSELRVCDWSRRLGHWDVARTCFHTLCLPHSSHLCHLYFLVCHLTSIIHNSLSLSFSFNYNLYFQPTLLKKINKTTEILTAEKRKK